MRNSVTDFAIVAILAIGFFLAFRREDEKDDPTWEERWRTLSAADRSRIKAAALSGALLADPDEIELAAGFARYKRRSLGIFNLAGVASAAAGVAFIAAGVVANSLVFVIGGALFLLRGLWILRYDHEVGRNFREAISRDRRV